MWGPKKLGAAGHPNGHHASRDERITKSSEQSVEHSMIRNRREKYLVFESPRRAPVHTRTSPHCTAGVDHRALRELSAVCSFLIFRLNAYNCNPTHGTQSYREVAGAHKVAGEPTVTTQSTWCGLVLFSIEMICAKMLGFTGVLVDALLT